MRHFVVKKIEVIEHEAAKINVITKKDQNFRYTLRTKHADRVLIEDCKHQGDDILVKEVADPPKQESDASDLEGGQKAEKLFELPDLKISENGLAPTDLKLEQISTTSPIND